MSCCCSSASQALVGASVFTLIVFVPVGFYELLQIFFHFDELDHQALSIVSTITCVGAVALAIFAVIGKLLKSAGVLGCTLWLGICWTAFAIAMTIWGATIQAQSSTELEHSISSAGLLVIFCLGFIISPLAWITYESFAYRRELQTAQVDIADAEGGPFLQRRQAKTDAIATPTQLQEKQSMAAELSKPFGRRRRGRKEHSYERPYSSESSAESEDAAPQQKRRGSMRS